MRLAHHDRILRLELNALRQHEIDLGRCTEGKDLKAIRMTDHHIQGTHANGAGGAQDGDALFLKGHEIKN